MAVAINIPIEDAVTDGSLNPITSNAVFDGLATKQPTGNYATGGGTATGTNTGDNATNTTSNSYADGKVADSITDSVTTIAPSQNAVFDALHPLNGQAWAIYGDSFSNWLVDDYIANVVVETGLVGTTYAVAGHTFSLQLAVIQSQIIGNANFFQDYDIVSIHLGVNDFAGSANLGRLDVAPLDSSIIGSLKGMIEAILTSNPLCNIFVITPPEANGAGVTYKAINGAGWTLSELSYTLGSVCRYYGVQCIDLYNYAPFNLKTIPTYTTDGLHPNTDGKAYIAKVVSSAFINNNSKSWNTNIGINNIQINDTVRSLNLNGSTLSEMLRINKLDGSVIASFLGNGKVGIGTSTPSKALSIGERILFGDDGVASWGVAGANGQLTWDTNKAIINGLGANALEFQSGDVPYVYIENNGDVILGRKYTFGTTQQTGMIYIPECAGIPTGIPTAYTGKVSLLFNSTDNILNVYNGAWKKFQSIISGITGSRPTVTDIGYQYFDTTLGKPIWWKGAVWVDATGATV